MLISTTGDNVKNSELRTLLSDQDLYTLGTKAVYEFQLDEKASIEFKANLMKQL